LLLLLFVFLKTPFDKPTAGMVADHYLSFFVLTFLFVWPAFGSIEELSKQTIGVSSSLFVLFCLINNDIPEAGTNRPPLCFAALFFVQLIC